MMAEPYCVSPARLLAEYTYRDLRLLHVVQAYRASSQEERWNRGND